MPLVVLSFKVGGWSVGCCLFGEEIFALDMKDGIVIKSHANLSAFLEVGTYLIVQVNFIFVKTSQKIELKTKRERIEN